MTDVIVLTEDQAAQLVYRDQFPHAILQPLRLTDGRYVLPTSTLTQPEHARWRHVLSAGTIGSVEALTFDTLKPGRFFLTTLSGVLMELTQPTAFDYPLPPLFEIPAPGLWRFEAHYNNDFGGGDRLNLRRRTELIQATAPIGYQSGDTVWAAWSTVITDQRAGFDSHATAIIHQWHQHPSSAYRPPPLALVLDSGVLTLNNRTVDGSGNAQLWTATAPDSGEVTHFVIEATLGEVGHITMWVNGIQVVDVATSVGYYAEVGMPYLLKLQYGIYMDNTHTVDALYHANVEFGTTDLSARVAAPLTVTEPAGGWT